jgi:hypothetical protein
MLVGEAVLRRVDQSKVELKQMMGENLRHPADRALFDLE